MSESKEPEYAESLKMLESAEGQNNAVFACFGSAAQRGQQFEEALRRFRRAVQRVNGAGGTPEDIERFVQGLSKKTMGQLLHEVGVLVAFNEKEVEERLRVALQARNFLIHNFFLERGKGFETQDGRMELLRELVSIDSELDACRVVLNAMRIALCRTLGIEDLEGNA